MKSIPAVCAAALSMASFFTASADNSTVVVSFDANGGDLEDDIRIVRSGGTYGGNVNLYPSDSPDNFSSFASDKISLADNLFTYSTSGRWCNYWTKPIEHILADRPYTYVIDVLTYSNTSSTGPWFNVGYTNGDQPAQLTGTYRQISGTGRISFDLKGREESGITVLGRDFVDFNHSDDGVCSMTFRVQLYAGRKALPAADVYVVPGETAVMALPVPTRQGFNFAGWKDASGNTVTAETEVPAEGGATRTLVAAWTRAEGTVMPVKVTFDPDGGRATEKFRIVNTEQPFGRTVNLFPSDSVDNFHGLTPSLANNVFTVDAAKDAWVNIFSKNIKAVEIGESYMYVLEVLSVEEGDLGYLAIGRTGGYWAGGQQIQLASTGVQVGSSTGVYAVPVLGADYEEGFTSFNYLGRDYFHPPSDVKATFRISLFAGRGVNASNYSYAAPGEGMPLALPVATKQGFVFDGWVDAEGNRVTDATIVEADGDIVLKAVWKPWSLAVANAERPQVGKALTLSTNYGDGTREDEDGAVTFKWFRGDFTGTYEATPVSDGASYTLVEGDLEHFLKGVCYIDGTATMETAVWFSKLPVVYIDTVDGSDIAFKADEKSANVRVQGNAEFKQQYNGAAKVKGRGNSTWGLPKKPYKVKLDKKTDMFGFGKNKHWVLLANFIDVSSMRNKMAYDMSGEFGLTYQASTWVEVVFNGRFDGTYQFGEHVRIDSTRVDIFDWEGESEDRGYTEEDMSWVDDDESIDVTGGYLWELSNEYDEVSKFKIDVEGNGESNGDIPVMFKYPEFAATSDRMMDWSSNFWSDVYTSWTSLRNTTADGSKSWKDLCDIDSMVSYWLINEIFGNHDAWYKSRYCYKDFDGKLTFGPVWDFDWGLGSVAVGMGDAAKWILARDRDNGWAVSFYKEWLDDPWFCLRAWEKYQEMRPKFAALFEGEDCEYDDYVAYLREAGLVEDARWGAERTAHYHENARTVATDAAMFKAWMTTRLAWLDTIFETPETLMSNIPNHQSAQQYFPYTEDRGWWQEHTGSYRPDDIGAAVSGQALAKNDLGLEASAKDETVAVDVIVNGRFISQVARADFGSVEIAKADWYERGHKTLVELIGYDSEGKMTARSHLIVDPVGVGCWEDVTSETAADEIVPAAQAAQLEALGVAALKVAGWAIAQKVAFDPEQAINLEAFALNCAPTSAGIAEEKAAFKLTITIDADGTPRVSLPEGKVYNVEPVIEGRETLEAGTWHAPYDAADRFFRGVIDLP